jgi:hypothetical protein
LHSRPENGSAKFLFAAEGETNMIEITYYSEETNESRKIKVHANDIDDAERKAEKGKKLDEDIIAINRLPEFSDWVSSKR